MRAAFDLRQLVILIPILSRRKPGDFFKNRSERLRIGITNIKHYFADIFPAAFKTSLSSFNFYTLHIFENSIICCKFKTTFKASPANGNSSRKFINRKFLCYIFLKILVQIKDFIFMSIYVHIL